MADSIADDLVAAQNLEQAVKMRCKGATWPEIAAACGYTDDDGNPIPSAALRAVGAAMAAATLRAEMTADQYRDEANLRLDHLLAESLKMSRSERHVTFDENGNEIVQDDRSVRLKAVDEARRLIEAQLKLNGVGAPKPDDQADTGGIRVIFEDRTVARIEGNRPGA